MNLQHDFFIQHSDIIVYNNNIWRMCDDCTLRINLNSKEPTLVFHTDMKVKSIFEENPEKQTVVLTATNIDRLIAEKEFNILRYTPAKEKEFNLLELPFPQN